METASPPVSPRVVAAILITQKARVTSGTLPTVRGMGRAVSRAGWRLGRGPLNDTGGYNPTDSAARSYPLALVLVSQFTEGRRPPSCQGKFTAEIKERITAAGIWPQPTASRQSEMNYLDIGDRKSLSIPVVLWGGSGTRLWPVSRDSFRIGSCFQQF